MTEPLPLRAALPAEFDRIADLCVDAYSTGGHLREGDPYTEVLRNVAARAQAGQVLVHERDGRIAGTVTVCPPGTEFSEIGRPGEFEFRFLAVDPDHWGTGVADALMQACEDEARATRARVLMICVRDTNTGAAAMYARRGFTRVPERDWTPLPDVHLLALTRPVTPD